MRNVTFKTVVMGLIAGVVLSACSKKEEAPVAPTNASYTRHLISYVEYGATASNIRTTYPSFTEGCIQRVEYRRVDQEEAAKQYIEFSSEVCPSEGVAEAVSVRAQFHVKEEAGKFLLYKTSEDTIFGEFTLDVDPFGGNDVFELKDLCSGSYSCTITIENTKLKSIE